MTQHDYHIATQAKFDALNTVIKQQAAQIEALTDRNKQLQSKLLDARLAGDRTRIDPQVEAMVVSKAKQIAIFHRGLHEGREEVKDALAELLGLTRNEK